MRFAVPRSLTAVFLAFVSLATTSAIKADTYSLGVVGTTGTGYFVAGDDFGDYSLQLYNTGACSSSASTCFANYNAATGLTTIATTQAILRSDPSPAAGVGCNISLAGARSLCNNGHQVLGGFYNGVLGVWALNDSVLERIWNGTLDGPAILTANGSLYFADGLNENLVAGVASPSAAATPEPSSLWLLGSGVAGMLGMVRRKRSA